MSEPELKARLVQRLENRSASVAVIGLGYVGLPLATAVAESGLRVVGIDLDSERVDGVNAGRSPIPDVGAENLVALVQGGWFQATTQYGRLAEADVIVIAVPTPIDEYRVPDLSAVQRAAQGVAETVTQGALVVLESTTYPGTTEEIVVPALRAQGLQPGHDVFVGYSPERIDPGNERWTVVNTPKIVSGLTKDCLEAVIAFYGCFVSSLVPLSNIRTAEITKLFENIFRIVNIALANEFQVICDSFDIDVWEVIEACSTKPFGFMPFYPGPGLGGHCVPVDPFYLAYKSREKNVNTEFIELAGRINASMPDYVVRKVARLLSSHHKAMQGARIALLGVAYKKNTADVRESPAIRLIELLLEEGAAVSYHDPHVPEVGVSARSFQSQPLLPEYLSAQDCAVVVTDHDDIDWTMLLQFSPAVVDTRNVLGRLRPQPQPRPAARLGT